MIPPLNWRAFYATDFPIASMMNTQTLEHTFWDYGQGWKLEAVATLNTTASYSKFGYLAQGNFFFKNSL
jgi:hypothetical protein